MHPAEESSDQESHILLSENQIAALLAAPKELPNNFYDLIHTMPLGLSSEQRTITVRGETDQTFRLILRRNLLHAVDFMVGIAYLVPGSSRVFFLRRYDGPSHIHRNKLENKRFLQSHIHMATERYQARGFKEEAYAEPTDRFTTFAQALQCALDDGTFTLPPSTQQFLFPLGQI